MASHSRIEAALLESVAWSLEDKPAHSQGAVVDPSDPALYDFTVGAFVTTWGIFHRNTAISTPTTTRVPGTLASNPNAPPTLVSLASILCGARIEASLLTRIENDHYQ